ncbi:MAG TPA: DUF3570 domain-containing protein [Candidatus Limnocylindria bacterium]|jgi:hypothetical protein|nr:DUF3570 domain-containing protein [Candidatus Limnocylindria bacterium]
MKYPFAVHHMNPARAFRLRGIAVIFAWLCQCWQPQRLGAEDRFEYRYEEYQEEGGRMHIRTHSAFFEAELDPKFVVRGQYVYDGISGATPTGGLPQPGSDKVPMVEVTPDLRHAYNVETDIKTGIFTTRPQVSYSSEHDYRSWGLALNESVELNQKNTTLNFGFARNIDKVSGTATSYRFANKDTWDAMVGVTQLLDPKTYLTVNFTFGMEHGFLSDPYRSISVFDPQIPAALGGDPAFTDVENRPSRRVKETVFVGLTHFFDRLNGSGELSYRFHNDDWDVIGNTVQITWNQKIGRSLTLSPSFRYHRQTAANFYRTSVKGLAFVPEGATYITDSAGNPAPIPFQALDYTPAPGEVVAAILAPYPTYYSSDYRLSELQSFTYGLAAHWRFHKHWSIDASYQRYEMEGLDGFTPQSAYPSANVFSAGIAFLW